ncbi:FAD-dependent oxidoreductase [Longimicrobium sp.]|uniref:FAD-dependent oxidoreductase n=1 Tax=Longimicrobium sp. TaxID=2029185 RepID=UPI002E36633C|nr:FAD-dependent oxidoreductase [Longimicrobium sp.]HEX6038663.1 FAD-dependent oxidoreductase [Longimicrobium sp.]
MEGHEGELTGPDLRQGVPAAQVDEGEMLLGHADGQAVLLLRTGGALYAVGAACTHYGVSLADGLLAEGTIRCPAHHAAFDPRTGDAVRAPALRPLPCWEVEERDGTIFVTRPRTPEAKTVEPRRAARADAPESIVIVGAGAAGSAAAERLRRAGYAGRLTMIGAEPSPPYDRPNVSKDYLAGTAPEAWMPLWPDAWFAEQGIDLVLGARATKIDPAAREVRTLSGGAYRYDRLLLATGADPVRLPIPTRGMAHVHYLHTLADARAVIAGAGAARTAVVVGASFIGLETAAALRARGLEVHVVSQHRHPMGQVLGPRAAAFIQALHERNGVVFHLEENVAAISPEHVTLRGGARLAARLVVVGIGVRPGVGLASWAGLALENGAVAVDEHLETSVPGIFAAGDLVAWPDPRTGRRIRSEHWTVAQRQGQTAALNMLGERRPFDDVPFFWSAHYDTTLRYVGHAERWDRIDVAGDLESGAATLAFRGRGADGAERVLAVATLGRDLEALRAEAALERYDWDALDAMAAGAEAVAA